MQQIYFSDELFKGRALEEAQKAFNLLQEGRELKMVSMLGSPSALKIPNSLMTLSKVREYIGPSLMNLAKNLEVGTSTPPVMVSGGYKIIYLLDKELAKTPDFNEIKSSISSEFLKRLSLIHI